jgi:hypothetical protein
MADRKPNDKSGPEPAPASERPHHIADEPLPEPVAEQPGVQDPVTDTGLPVEDQIRKEWDPNKDGGLPTPLSNHR